MWLSKPLITINLERLCIAQSLHTIIIEKSHGHVFTIVIKFIKTIFKYVNT